MGNFLAQLVGAVLVSALVPALQAQTPSHRYTVPELVREMTPAVVHVAALDARGKTVRLGSGGILSVDGRIVTSFHIIDGAAAAQIKTRDGEIYDKVDVVDYDIRRDIVVLKIRPFRPLATLNIASDDDLVIGDDVAVIGNPEGLDASVSAGIVSGRRQATGYQLIQTTAPISPGSSGGPLFDMQGRVIGITTSALRGDGVQNLNFAVPVLYLRPLIDSKESGMPIAEFTRKIAQLATSVSSRGNGDVAVAAPSMSWRVVHDHGHFDATCVGTLQLDQKSAELGFSSDTGSDSWSIGLSTLANIAKNVSYGRDRQAFHIEFNLKTYNFIALNGEGRPADPGNIIDVIKEAKQNAKRGVK